MDGKEFTIELRQDMRNLRFHGREYLTPVQGRYDSINQTLFCYFNYKGPGFREKFTCVTQIVEMDGTFALKGWDEEQRCIRMRPLRAQRGQLIVTDGREILNALFGYPSCLNPMDGM